MSATLSHDEAYERLLANPGVVFLLGGIDTGKTTFGIELASRGAAAGIPTAIVDADIVQSTVGPPTTVGLKFVTADTDMSRDSLRRADAMGFVGSIIPKGHLLPLTSYTGKLVTRARNEGMKLIVVDTTALVSGIYGQTLKFFKMDLVAPDTIVAFERGGELDPITGIASRFTAAEVLEVPVASSVVPRTAEERVTFRERQFASYLGDHGGSSVPHWRIKPSVFMPTLPPEFDLALLHGLVVGAEDGKGNCVGIGVLEYDQGEDILRMASPVTEGVRGLRLGSLRIDMDGRSRGPVDLRHLFGTD